MQLMLNVAVIEGGCSGGIQGLWGSQVLPLTPEVCGPKEPAPVLYPRSCLVPGFWLKQMAEVGLH